MRCDKQGEGLKTYGLGLATLGRINLDLDGLAALVSANNLGSSLEVNALLLENLLRLLGNLEIHPGATNDVEVLNNSNLSSQSRPNRGHLKTNNTTTDDEELLGDLLKRDGAGAGDNALLVDLEAGEGSSLAASRDQNVLADDAGLATIVELNLDGVLVLERASSLEILNAVLLEEELNTLRETGNGLFLRLHQLF